MRDIYDILQRYYGYSSFRPGQEELVRSILSGRDALAVMPTGSGKSICYQVPAIAMQGITLVVSPLISLMKDQVGALNQAGVRAAYLNSSLTPRQHVLAMQNARAGMYKVIYVAPERLFMDVFQEFALQAEISMVAVDEAHCISQWGHDFRPSYTRVAEFIEKLSRRPVVAAFTATATRQVKEDILRQLRLQDPYCVTTGFDRKNLCFRVERPRDKSAYVVSYVKKHTDRSGIVYCMTRKGVDELCAELLANGVQAASYHAGLPDEERQKNQDDFLYDRCRVMVATNAFGMGIDKSNVSFVIHYNMPMNLEQYYQEAGRAGRDGEEADCVLLYAPMDVRLCRFLIDKGLEDSPGLSSEQRETLREREYEKLKQMTFYATLSTCLRRFLLRYFGEQAPYECGNCGNCLHLREEERFPSARFPSHQNRPLAKTEEFPVDEGLLAALKQTRRELSAAAKVPAYVIFSDATLRDMCRKRPGNMEEMKKVSGVGAYKLDRFGRRFLQAMQAYQDAKNK